MTPDVLVKAKATLRGERGPPPYFAGRDSELEALDRRANSILRAPKASADGLLLITGVPGVGKTHLAKHYIEQRKEDRRVEGLVVDTDMAASPEGLIALIGEAMGAEGKFVKAAGTGDKVSGARAGAAGTVTAGFTVDTHRPDVKFADMLRATRNLKAWQGRVLVLVVDEVQNLTADSAEQVRALHMGEHGCPIFAVATGLPPAREVLSRHGISRMSHRRLGLLLPNETTAAVYHGLRNLGLDVREEVANEVADACMCFPQHVHSYLEATVDVGERRREIDSQDALKDILRAGQLLREEYYVGRMSAVERVEKLYPLVEHMRLQKDGAVERGQAEAIVRGNVVDAAVHHGVLTATEDGVLSFGIPSFGSYMAKRAARHQEFLQSRRDTVV